MKKFRHDPTWLFTTPKISSYVSDHPVTAKLTKSSNNFGTPYDVAAELHEEFLFTIDAFASPENHLLERYWSEKDDAFTQSWAHERVFANPPYSRGFVRRAAEKCYEETALDCHLAVLLIPTRTEQDWWHRVVDGKRVIALFYKRRVPFKGGEGGARDKHVALLFRRLRSWT